MLETLGLTPQRYAVLTVHRSENTEAGKLIEPCGTFAGLARQAKATALPIITDPTPLRDVLSAGFFLRL